FPGSFDIVGTGTSTINYTSSDTLLTLRDAINVETGTTGVTATVVQDGNGFRLDLDSATDFTLTDTNGLLNELGVNDDLVIERTSNTVNDLFTGITLSLFAAEARTVIKLEVEPDLSGVKTAITGFVDAYNAVRQLINSHSLTDSTTGLKSDDAGVLFGERTLSDARLQLSNLVSQGVTGVDADFRALSQIGVDFIGNDFVSDPLLKENLVVNETVLDNALLNNLADVRRLFSFDLSTSDPRVSLANFTNKTSYTASGYVLNLDFDYRLQGDTFTNTSVYSQVNAETGGPASDGISKITFGTSVTNDQAFRYSYNGTTEDLTLRNLTAGTSETINITALLDAVAGPAPADLGAGQSISVSFSTLDLTISLSGDNGFARATDIADGTLNTAGLDANTAMTTGAVTTPTSGMDKATVDALIAAGAYDQATGLLTLGVTSNGLDEVHFDAATGILFQVDGGGIGAGPTVDVDDLGAHTVQIYVNDGVSDVEIASLTFDQLHSTLAGSGSLTIDLGTGLLAESSSMSSFTSVVDGSFEIFDSTNTSLGTVNYLASDSLDELATKISAISNVTATLLTTSSTLQLEIVHDTGDAITLQNDTGGALTELNITDDASSILSANIGGAADGADDGTVTVNGRIMTVTDQSGAEGLQLIYSGSADSSAIQLDYTIGFGADLFSAMDNFIDTTTGSIQAEIASLEAKNLLAQDRIVSMELRIAILRKSLTSRFVALETALATANNIQEFLRQQTEAIFNGN
ncbi:MAG: flagellar filament capping protein FliD, partial [Alphaproteobacteria bacterium]